MRASYIVIGLLALAAGAAPATSPTHINPSDVVARREQLNGARLIVGGILFREGDKLCVLDTAASLDGGIPRARIAIIPGHDYRFTIDGPGEANRIAEDRDAGRVAGMFVFVEGIFRAHRPRDSTTNAEQCSEWGIEPSLIRLPAPRPSLY